MAAEFRRLGDLGRSCAGVERICASRWPALPECATWSFGFTEEEQRDLDLGFERVLGELKQRAESAKPSRALLVLDNVDQPKLLEPAQVRRSTMVFN